jgi:general secretion pathway protein K
MTSRAGPPATAAPQPGRAVLRPARPSGQRGLALLAAIWVVGLLAVMAMDVLLAARRDSRQGTEMGELARLEAAAEAGLALAVRALLQNPPGDAAGPHAFDGSTIFVQVEPEAGKVDVNLAGPELLAAVFEAAGQSRPQARAWAALITDWRDSDQAPEPGGGMEAAEYRRLGRGVLPRNSEFQAVSELMELPGMTAELLDLVGPALTVHGLAAEPEIRLAPPMVRAAIVAARRRSGAEAPARAPQGATPRGGLAGQAFTLRIEARRSTGRVAHVAVVRLTGNRLTPYWVQDWR